MNIIRPKSKQQMPDDARLVFKGKIFDVYQWEQEGYDGSKHIFEKLKRPDTVVTIPVTVDGKIVIATETQPGKEPYVSLMGGRMEDGEDVLAVAKRELSEESGLSSDDWELFMSWQPYPKIDWAIFVFIARNCVRVQAPNLDGAEKIECREVSFDEFVDIAASDNLDLLGPHMQIEFLKARHDADLFAKLKKKILGIK